MQRPISTDMQPWLLALAAFRRVWQNRDDLIRLAAAPAVVIFLLNLWLRNSSEKFFVSIQQGQQPDPEAAMAVQGPALIVALASWVIMTVFAANWMRTLMLGSGAIAGLGISVGRRHMRLLGMSLLFQLAAWLSLTILLALTMLIAPIFSVIAAVLILFTIWYVIAIARLCPVWVGISIDAPMKMRDAWKRTEGFGVSLAVAIVVVAAFLMVPLILIFDASFRLGATEAAPLAFSFISVVVQFVLFAVIGAVFVLAYPRFVSETV